MNKHILLLLSLIFAFLPISACGGGGGGSGTSTPATVYTKAILKIELTGTLSTNAVISGADFTLTLPANVTPTLTTSSEVASGVVTLDGTFAGGILATPVYIPATTTKGTLRLPMGNAVDPGVTTVGEIATITLLLASGAAPTLADFGNLSNVSVLDALYNPITGMSAKIASVTLQ